MVGTGDRRTGMLRVHADYIDVYQIHRPGPDTDIWEKLSALTDLVRSGKIRAFGTSGMPASNLVEAHWVAERRGLEPIRTEQRPAIQKTQSRRRPPASAPPPETGAFTVAFPHAGNPQPYPGRTAAITWRGAGLTMGWPSITTVGTVSLPPATERTKAAASGSRQMLTCRTER